MEQWNTHALGNVGCTTAHFFANSGIVKSVNVCPETSEQGVYYVYWPANRNFQDGTQACNGWAKIDGFPCEYIET